LQDHGDDEKQQKGEGLTNELQGLIETLTANNKPNGTLEVDSATKAATITTPTPDPKSRGEKHMHLHQHQVHITFTT